MGGSLAAERRQGGIDGADDARIIGEHVGREAGYDAAVTIDQEFFKVPQQIGKGIGLRTGLREKAVEICAEAGIVDLRDWLCAGEEPSR